MNKDTLRVVLEILRGETVHLEYEDEEGPKTLDEAQILRVMKVYSADEVVADTVDVRIAVPISMQERIGASEIDLEIPIDQIKVLKLYCKR